MSVSCILLTLHITCTLSLSAQLSYVQPGKLPVAFSSLTFFDTSRPAVDEQVNKAGRIIQLNLWFPANASGSKLKFTDYVALAGLELDSAENNPLKLGGERYFAWPISVKADTAQIARFIENPAVMKSHRSKSYPKTTCPLILLVHGFAADWAYLAEYLASYGYLVAHIPVKGSLRYELDYEGNGMEYQVLDYEFAIKKMKTELHLQFNDASVVGFSFGGQSATLLAMRNNFIKSIQSLDGGIGSEFGAGLLQSHPSYTDPGKLRKPLLHIFNPRDPYTRLGFVEKWPSDLRFIVPIKSVEHGHFTSFGIIHKRIPTILGPAAPDPGPAYESIMLMVRAFADTTLGSGSLSTWLNELRVSNPWIAATMSSSR